MLVIPTYIYIQFRMVSRTKFKNIYIYRVHVLIYWVITQTIWLFNRKLKVLNTRVRHTRRVRATKKPVCKIEYSWCRDSITAATARCRVAIADREKERERQKERERVCEMKSIIILHSWYLNAYYILTF